MTTREAAHSTRRRYRWRTALRTRLPWFLLRWGVAAKGRRDCGDHDWYNEDGHVEHCMHCRAGERPYDPRHFASRQ